MAAWRFGFIVCALCVSASILGANAGKERIVFLGDSGSPTAVFISDADGQNERCLTPAALSGYNPSLSPDGKWIIFTSDQSGSADIYRMHPDGTSLERVIDSPGFDDQGALSPDGRKLAFVSTREGGMANIWLLDLAQHRYSNLTQSKSGNFRPSWSPDGQWIAFSSDRDTPHTRTGPDRPPPSGSGCCGWELQQFTALYIVHPDGSGLRRLTPVDQLAGSPKWSPDGTHIVYYLDDRVPSQKQAKVQGATQIASLDIASGVKQVYTSGAQNKGAPQYLSNTKIAYLVVENGKVVLADTDGWKGSARDLMSPSWSADGKVVIYARGTAEQAPRPNPLLKFALTDSQFDLYRADYSLSYSPDGRLVLFSGSFVGDPALLVMNADGSNRRTLFDAKDRKVGIVSPVWSPDGRFIAFTMGRFGLRNPNTPAQLALVKSDGSDLKILVQDNNNNGYPSFSPDGKRLVYRAMGQDQGLRILSLADGKITRLTTEWDNFPAWSPRGDRILFTSFRTGDFEIYTVRPDGSDVRQLTQDHGNDAHAIWSPDGKSILFTTSRTGWKDEMWLGGGGQAYGEIAVMRQDGTHVRQLSDDQREEAADAWLGPAQ
jgi:TolB protein